MNFIFLQRLNRKRLKAPLRHTIYVGNYQAIVVLVITKPLLVSPSTSPAALTWTLVWPALLELRLHLRRAKISTKIRMRRYTICPTTSSCNTNFSSLCKVWTQYSYIYIYIYIAIVTREEQVWEWLGHGTLSKA